MYWKYWWSKNSRNKFRWVWKGVCIFLQNLVILAVIVLTISIGNGAYFVYKKWYLIKDVILVKFGTHTQTTI